MASLVCTVERTQPADLPAEVRTALQPGPAVLVGATDGTRTVACLVASVATRTVEVFHLADPRLGLPEGLVLAAAHFSDAGGRAFNDAYRTSPSDGSRPDARLHFRETYRYREPGTVVLREQLDPGGEVQEQVMKGVDLSDRYLPWPPPGDWAPLVRFPGR